MAKTRVTDARFDFRGGLNTAVSPDLLNPNELVLATNARLVSNYGAITKRSGTQRIHATAFPATINGVFQWDVPTASGGKQTVVISNGSLYYRDGLSYTPAFQIATTSSVARSSAAQGSSAGWTDPDGLNDGKNIFTGVAVDTTSGPPAAGSRLTLTVGDPAANNNRDAADDLYTFSFKINANGTALGGVDGFTKSKVQWEVSVDGGAFADVGSVYTVIAGVGESTTTKFTAVMTVAGAPAVSVVFRAKLTVEVGKASLGTTGTGSGFLQCFDTVYLTDNFPVTWVTGAAGFSTTSPAIFVPFRDSSAGAPLVLFIASGGHLFKWVGDTATLTQLDPTNNAPLANLLAAYHTRLFAGQTTLPKNLFWSKIGDGTFWTTGPKTDGGSAIVDILSGESLKALEVIGGSLLLATQGSVSRFTGHASDDIIIAQETEGISADVGAVGPLALKRFENVAAMLAVRGPYAVTETHVEPIGEQIAPSFDSLDGANISKAVIGWNRGRKELLFSVPGASDAGLNKTIFVQAVRLQAWYGAWTYAFGISYLAHYEDALGNENVIAGCSDGFVRLLDVGSLDDVLYNGTGGSNITMTVELPVIQFGSPGFTKALSGMFLQATLPSGSALKVKHSFDGATFSEESVTSIANDEQNYRIDMNNQGKRLRLQFVDASAQAPVLNGYVLESWNYART